jgi:hypothetical protein
MAYTLLDAKKFHEIVPFVTGKQNFMRFNPPTTHVRPKEF